jgi:hypothetical protein
MACHSACSFIYVCWSCSFEWLVSTGFCKAMFCGVAAQHHVELSYRQSSTGHTQTATPASHLLWLHLFPPSVPQRALGAIRLSQ